MLKGGRQFLKAGEVDDEWPDPHILLRLFSQFYTEYLLLSYRYYVRFEGVFYVLSDNYR